MILLFVAYADHDVLIWPLNLSGRGFFHPLFELLDVHFGRFGLFGLAALAVAGGHRGEGWFAGVLVGGFVKVFTHDLGDAVRQRADPVGSEPAGAAAYAGLVKAVDEGLVGADDRVVVLSTGSGLKDVASAMKAVAMAKTEPMRIAPSLSALQEALNA